MKTKQSEYNRLEYTQLTIKAPSLWEEALTALLFAYGAPGVEVDDPAIIAAHLAAGDWDASVFQEQDLATGQVTLRALFAEEIPPGLYEDIAALSPEPGLFHLSTAPLPTQDWQQVWRESFPTLLLGDKLAITPHWRKDYIPPEFAPLFISPGTSFGTGDHATTALVIELLAEYTLPSQQVLDIGSGSGILAIAALKLGAAKALAVDIDPDCAKSLAEHRELNGISREQLPFLQGDILTEAGLQQACREFKAHLVVSNIVAAVIQDLAASVGSYLQPGGLWLSSGILLEKEAAVTRAFADQGWQIAERRQRGEWLAFAVRCAHE